MDIWNKVSQKRSWLLALEGIVRFVVLLPLLQAGNWTQAGLGLLVVGCLLWCGLTVLLERRMWEEDALFEGLVDFGRRGIAITAYAGLVWFFIAQASVFLRLCLFMVVRIWDMIRTGSIASWTMQSEGVMSEPLRLGKGGLNLVDSGTPGWAEVCAAAGMAVVLLPVLTAVVVNSVFYLRRLCGRLWRELPKELPDKFLNKLPMQWLDKLPGKYSAQNLFWWAALLLVFAMTAGYRDEFSAAGFYLAYNWQLLLSFLALFCVFCTLRKKYGKRDCRD